jgi:ParB/RepB/Spo0J family partition protein
MVSREPKTIGQEEGASPPQVRHIAVNGIAYARRLRGLNDENVKRLCASMREVGLINPITLRPQKGVGYWLVAGLHRLEAAKRLHWDSIPAIIVEAEDTEARLAEIDENLMRGELTPAERALHVAERKRLYEEMHPETKNGGDRKSSKISSQTLRSDQIDRFTADTARKTGTSERKVQLDAARGNKIKNLDKVIGTSLDKGEELDALARLEPEQQDEIITRAAAGDNVSARQRLTSPPSHHPQDDAERSIKWRRSFEKVWNSAPSAADREWAMEWIDRPIMDGAA